MNDNKLKLAADPATAPELLAVLAEDPFGRVRLAVAQNPSTPSHVKSRLAVDECDYVRAWIPPIYAEVFGDGPKHFCSCGDCA